MKEDDMNRILRNITTPEFFELPNKEQLDVLSEMLNNIRHDIENLEYEENAINKYISMKKLW